MVSDATRLNETLKREAPALWRCLSPLGLQAAFPKGIPYQAAAARGTRFNATAGQLTDGAGAPLPLPAMAHTLAALDPKTCFLYSPIEGALPLREAWLARSRALAHSQAPASLPFTTHGLTHALSVLADLFVDADTELVLPAPHWENYKLVFGFRAPHRTHTFPFFEQGRFNVAGFAEALQQVKGKAMVLLNLPGNPSGYAPPAEDIEAIVNVILEHRGPAVIVIDDAYAGTLHEPGLLPRSLFWELADRVDPERAVVFKVDGATKELLFFPSRIGFLTHTAVGSEDAERAMLSKLRCVVRATSGCPAGPSQALVLQALNDAGLDAAFAARMAVLSGRYRALKAALNDHADVLRPWPFNSAYFAMIGVPKGRDVDTIRRRLISEQSVGTIALPSVGAIRLAYCSVAEDDIPELVRRVAVVAAS